MFKYIVGIFFLFIFALALPIGMVGAAEAAKVPDFSFPAVADGHKVDIRDYRGKVVLINYWATWCGPCIQEIPSLNSLHDEFGSQGFEVIGMSIDQGGERVVAKMIERAGIKYPIVISSRKLERQFGGVYGVPTSFLVDRSGNVLKRYTGYTSHDVFVEDIKEAIK